MRNFGTCCYYLLWSPNAKPQDLRNGYTVFLSCPVNTRTPSDLVWCPNFYYFITAGVLLVLFFLGNSRAKAICWHLLRITEKTVYLFAHLFAALFFYLTSLDSSVFPPRCRCQYMEFQVVTTPDSFVMDVDATETFLLLLPVSRKLSSEHWMLACPKLAKNRSVDTWDR